MGGKNCKDSSSPIIQGRVDSNNLIVAIPKKGRLHESCISLLHEIGFTFKRHHRTDIAVCLNVPATLIFLNVIDIPVYVAQGNVDCGIVGLDVVAETAANVCREVDLGFGRCRLVLQAPVGSPARAEEFIGKRVVTSYPRLTRSYFEAMENKETPTEGGAVMPMTTTILTVSGSVEASVALGLSDCISDLVESGETMRSAGLMEIGTLMNSEAVLISNPNTKNRELLQKLKMRVYGYLGAQRYQMVSYNIHKRNLARGTALTPGLTSPNIVTLIQDGWFSVTAVALKSGVMDLMDNLASVGAVDILALEFKHCRLACFNDKQQAGSNEDENNENRHDVAIAEVAARVGREDVDEDDIDSCSRLFSPTASSSS